MARSLHNSPTKTLMTAYCTNSEASMMGLRSQLRIVR